MLVLIWMCVMAQAFVPGGQQLMQAGMASMQAQLRADMEAPATFTSKGLIGAAGHVARHRPALAR